MQVYLAAMETGDYVFDNMPDDYIPYGFVSFHYVKDDKQMEMILSKCQNLMVDSGAFSFQQGQNANYDSYMSKYKHFVKKWTHHPKIRGFFEMDIDIVAGVEKVLEYRRQLEAVSDKIIPVWHATRSIEDFYKMCDEYSGRRVSITGYGDADIYFDQVNAFINKAHQYGCNVHILGMTRFKPLQTLNLHKDDSVDSTSWKQTGIFGGLSLLDSALDVKKFSCLNGLDISYKPLITCNLLGFLHASRVYRKRNESIYL